MNAPTPGLPTVTGFTIRHYRGEADIPALRDVLQADQDAAGIEGFVTLEALQNFYRHLVNCDPAHDMLLVEGPAGLVAYGRVSWGKEFNAPAYQYPISVHMRPEARGQGLGRALLAWLEARAVANAAAHGHPRSPAVRQHWQTDGTDRETAKTALLARAGYTPVRYSYAMVRPNLDDIPDRRLPAGLEVRPVLPEHYQAIWKAKDEAFQDHWGITEPSEDDDDEGWKTITSAHAELWKVAWDIASNQVAGMVLGYIMPEENEKFQRRRGYTENIAVRRPWRTQGVASALIAENLRALKARGMTEAALGVDAENLTGALRVYEAMGFRQVQRSAIYRKPFPSDV